MRRRDFSSSVKESVIYAPPLVSSSDVVALKSHSQFFLVWNSKRRVQIFVIPDKRIQGRGPSMLKMKKCGGDMAPAIQKTVIQVHKGLKEPRKIRALLARGR